MKNRGLHGLRDLLPRACHPAFLQLPGPPAQGGHLQWARPPHTKHQLRRCTIGLLTGQTGGDIFSLQVPFSL